jgi:hypothetical protein
MKNFQRTFTFCLLLSSLLPSFSLACSCAPPGPVLKTILNDVPNAVVLTGRIIGELKLTNPTDQYRDLYYAFKVNRVLKAPCTIHDGNLILVSTSASSALCGVQLKTNTLYTLSAYAAFQQDGAVEVQVGSCDYRNEGELSAEDKQTIRQYQKNNVRVCAKLCETGADCDQTKEYCNVAKNQCTVIDAVCPNPPGSVECFADPCTVTRQCEEAASAIQPVTCIDNYCGGCNAIFIDANRTQICNTAPPS